MDSLSATNGPVGAVTNAARILGFLAEARAPLRLTQISRPLGINTSTCLNILRTLAAEGLVRVDAAAKTYGLGRRLVELARDTLNHGENLGALRPAMEALAQRHGITVMLWGRLDADRLILLSAAVGEPLRSIHVELGMTVPLLTGSMGRLFAAGMDPAEMRRRFDAIDWKRPLDFDAYGQQVDEAAAHGWSLDAGYLSPGIWGASAPVPHPGGALDRVVSVVLLDDAPDAEAIERIAHELISVSRA
jgi:DNA-binding IclR family transcriptional regulator